MYFPILRGRQNELLALRELSERGILSKKVVPVIEPVKLSSTLVSTIRQLSQGQRIVFVNNPRVGSYKNESVYPKNRKYVDELDSLITNQIQVKRGYIVNEKAGEFYIKWQEDGVLDDDLYFICQTADCLKEINMHEMRDVNWIVPYTPTFRRIRGKKILWEDAFNRKEKNSEYTEPDDEFFSNSHIYYKEEGFVGFADYSIIGSYYSESGFAPYAVALHIVYFDDNKELRVHHFVSDDREDSGDTAVKLYQALEKLALWNEGKNYNTLGMQQLLDIYNKQSYPGLGVIKKMSIMHHIELMGGYLDRRI